MYYSVSIYPRLNAELSEKIDIIRKAHDPTWSTIEPHIDICFPASAALDEGRLIDHIEQALSGWSPFDICLNGFHKSRDHWLFLMVQEGEAEIRKLNSEIYTGYLAEFRKKPGKPGYDFKPHLGLGLFVKAGSLWDWRNPRESDLDQARYEEALSKAVRLPLPWKTRVDNLHLTAIPDILTEWTTGKRADYPGEIKMIAIHEFRLGKRD